MRKIELNHYLLSKFSKDDMNNPAIHAFSDRQYKYVITEDDMDIGIHTTKFVTEVLMISSVFISKHYNRRQTVGVIRDRAEDRIHIHPEDFIKYYRDNPPIRFCFCDEEMFQEILKNYRIQLDWMQYQLTIGGKKHGFV